MILYRIGITIVAIDAVLILISAAAVIIKKKNWRSPSAVLTFWRSLFKNSTLWQSLLVGVALLAVGAGQVSSEKNLNLAKEQTRLQLRPFITVIEPLAILAPDNEGKYWLTISYKLKNVGLQPAHECQVKNDKAIEISLPEKFTQVKNDKAIKISLPEKVKLVESRKWRNNTMKKVSKYLENNPMADREQIDGNFQGITGCLPDMEQEFIRQPTAISPRNSRTFGTTRCGATSIASIHGKILLYYLYLTYEDSLGEECWTSYVCYFDKNDPSQAQQIVRNESGSLIYPLIEYRQCMDRKSLD